VRVFKAFGKGWTTTGTTARLDNAGPDIDRPDIDGWGIDEAVSQSYS